MSGATIFHLIRHGAHDLLGNVLAGRKADVDLNALGERQALALAEDLSRFDIQAVVSSPLRRTRATADPIASALNRTVELDPAFNEIDFGSWAGLPFAALDDDPEWHRFNCFRSTVVPPGGESMLQAQHRALAGIMRWRANVPDGEVVVVSHADTIKLLVMHFLGMPLDLIHRFEVSPGSRSVLKLFEGSASLDALNLPPGC